MGQRYAAAARSGSMPKDSGISWPRSVMHGPDKHRSLFEAFAGLQRDSTGGMPNRQIAACSAICASLIAQECSCIDR